jgi:hypothetical protein
MIGRLSPFRTPAMLAAMLAACGQTEVDLPTPPLAEETAAVADVYENPPGVIDVAQRRGTSTCSRRCCPAR